MVTALCAHNFYYNMLTVEQVLLLRFLRVPTKIRLQVVIICMSNSTYVDCFNNVVQVLESTSKKN